MIWRVHVLIAQIQAGRYIVLEAESLYKVPLILDLLNQTWIVRRKCA